MLASQLISDNVAGLFFRNLKFWLVRLNKDDYDFKLLDQLLWVAKVHNEVGDDF